jgi:Spy/CpxP family protein refolding chaperone
VALAAAASLSFAGKAHAQRGMGMMGGGQMAGFRVLTTPEGVTELKLTEDQKSKLQELSDRTMESMREKMQALRDELQGSSPEEGREKMQAAMKELADATYKDLKSILDEGQYARYHQINLQAMGVDAFSQKEVQDKLKITDDQKQKIESLGADLREELRGLRDEFQNDFQGMMQKSRELRAAALAKVTELLTEDQKGAWKELTGKPFTMPPFQFRGRGN